MLNISKISLIIGVGLLSASSVTASEGPVSVSSHRSSTAVSFSPSLFLLADYGVDLYFQEYEVSAADRKKVVSRLSQSMQRVFADVNPESIFVFKLRSLLLSQEKTAGSGAGTAADAGGPSAASSLEEETRRWLTSKGFHELSTHDLFGSPSPDVANAFLFFSKTKPLKGSITERFKAFIKALDEYSVDLRSRTKK